MMKLWWKNFKQSWGRLAISVHHLLANLLNIENGVRNECCYF